MHTYEPYQRIRLDITALCLTLSLLSIPGSVIVHSLATMYLLWGGGLWEFAKMTPLPNQDGQFVLPENKQLTREIKNTNTIRQGFCRLDLEVLV